MLLSCSPLLASPPPTFARHHLVEEILGRRTQPSCLHHKPLHRPYTCSSSQLHLADTPGLTCVYCLATTDLVAGHTMATTCAHVNCQVRPSSRQCRGRRWRSRRPSPRRTLGRLHCRVVSTASCRATMRYCLRRHRIPYNGSSAMRTPHAKSSAVLVPAAVHGAVEPPPAAVVAVGPAVALGCSSRGQRRHTSAHPQHLLH